MKLARVILLTCLVAFSLLPIRYVLGETIIKNEKVTITITILDAFYTDADDGGIENDIVTKFRLDVDHHSDKDKHCTFYLYLKLTLPSGLCYIYAYIVYCTGEGYAILTAYLYNHATESGWYCVKITGVLQGGNPQTRAGTESFYFDPPGSTPGTEPLTCEIVV